MQPPARQADHARLVEIIASRADGITRSELMELVYADDIDGGPDSAGTISMLVHFANKQLQSQGWRMVSERGPVSSARVPIATIFRTR